MLLPMADMDDEYQRNAPWSGRTGFEPSASDLGQVARLLA
jgi:hypothetical protein